MSDYRMQVILAAKDVSKPVFTAFSGSIKALSGQLFSLKGAALSALGVGGLGALIKGSLDAADLIGKTADKLGVTTDALQEYRFAASQSGVETKVFDMAMQRFTRRLAEAAQGKGELVAVLKQYNIAAVDSAGKTRDVNAVMGELADVIARTDDRSERLRIAFKAFDSEGAKLVNMLRNGSAGLNKLRQEARDLGIVLSEDVIRKSEAANDQLDKLGRIVKTQITVAVAELAPHIVEIVGNMTEWVKQNKEFMSQDLPGYIDKIGVALAAVSKYAGLRSVSGTMAQGAKLAGQGLIDWDKFVGVGFYERQQMVDAALAKQQNVNVSSHEQWRLSKSFGGRPLLPPPLPPPPGPQAYPMEAGEWARFRQAEVLKRDRDYQVFTGPEAGEWARFSQAGILQRDAEVAAAGREAGVGKALEDVFKDVDEASAKMAERANFVKDTWTGAADGIEAAWKQQFFDVMDLNFTGFKDTAINSLRAIQNASNEILFDIVKDWTKGLLKSALSGFAGTGSTGFAEGGILTEPVVGRGLRSGKVYTFAEREPEMFVPRSKAGAGSLSINVPVTVAGTAGNPQVARLQNRLRAEIEATVKTVVRQEMRS
jgi:hypothetical protein